MYLLGNRTTQRSRLVEAAKSGAFKCVAACRRQRRGKALRCSPNGNSYYAGSAGACVESGRLQRCRDGAASASMNRPLIMGLRSRTCRSASAMAIAQHRLPPCRHRNPDPSCTARRQVPDTSTTSDRRRAPWDARAPCHELRSRSQNERLHRSASRAIPESAPWRRPSAATR